MESSPVIKIEKANGTFIIFKEYDNEENFSEFVNFLEFRLGVPVVNSVQYPYSLAGEINLPEGQVVAMFHDDVGCCILVPIGLRNITDFITLKCYPMIDKVDNKIN